MEAVSEIARVELVDAARRVRSILASWWAPIYEWARRPLFDASSALFPWSNYCAALPAERLLIDLAVDCARFARLRVARALMAAVARDMIAGREGADSGLRDRVMLAAIAHERTHAARTSRRVRRRLPQPPARPAR